MPSQVCFPLRLFPALNGCNHFVNTTVLSNKKSNDTGYSAINFASTYTTLPFNQVALHQQIDVNDHKNYNLLPYREIVYSP